MRCACRANALFPTKNCHRDRRMSVFGPNGPSSECLTSVHPGSGADRQKTTQIRRPHTEHRTTVVRHFETPGPVSSDDRDAPKAGRGRSTPRRRLLGKRHPEPRARVHPVRLKLSRRQADDRLLRLQFAIIIARGNLRPCRGQSYVPVIGLLLPDRTSMLCIWPKTSQRERGSGR